MNALSFLDPDGFKMVLPHSSFLEWMKWIDEGCLFRGDDGRFVGAAAIPSPCASSLMAEALAIRMGLKLADTKHLTPLILETDSKVVMHFITHLDHPPPWEVVDVIGDIRHMLRQIPEVHVVHCYRETNTGAD